MGWLGMGITQSDTFCEVYDEFIASYHAGKEPLDISQSILDEYEASFDSANSILNEVYFAIAKAQWMCGALSPQIMETVQRIASTNSDIGFLRDLGADEHDLRLREKNIAKFVNRLSTPRKFPLVRKPPILEKSLPDFVVGNCYSYKVLDKYYAILILDKIQLPRLSPMFLCCLLNRAEKAPLIEIDENLEKARSLALFSAREFLPFSRFRYISSVTVDRGFASRWFENNQFYIGNRSHLLKYTCNDPAIPISQILRLSIPFEERNNLSPLPYCILDYSRDAFIDSVDISID